MIKEKPEYLILLESRFVPIYVMDNLPPWALKAAVGLGAVLLVSLISSRLILRTRKKKKITRIIDTIEEFRKPNVRMKNPERVEEIVCQLIKGGSPKLHVITDFDGTITRTHFLGKRSGTSHNALSSSPLVSMEFRKRATALHEKYYPIEVDPNLSPEEKIPLMIEWYALSHDNLKCSGITKHDIPKFVQASGTMFRDGCDTLFETLRSHNIPILIFSAGLGDVLEELLKQNNVFYPNIRVVSNYMQFDDEGKIVGFKGDLIHMYNKNESSLNDSHYLNQIKDRGNIILLGDTLGDLTMHCGVPSVNTILRIGFLNDHVDERLPQFLESFDIVLIDDQTMDVVNGLLRHVL